jgi:hypothetical protein
VARQPSKRMAGPHPLELVLMYPGGAGRAAGQRFTVWVSATSTTSPASSRTTSTTRIRRRCSRTLLASWGTKPRLFRCLTNHEHHEASARRRWSPQPTETRSASCCQGARWVRRLEGGRTGLGKRAGSIRTYPGRTAPGIGRTGRRRLYSSRPVCPRRGNSCWTGARGPARIGRHARSGSVDPEMGRCGRRPRSCVLIARPVVPAER